jgi:hypothetical protein
VPRTHQYVVTLMVHTNPIKPATTPGPHIGNLNEEQARRGRHPERRSTGLRDTPRERQGIDLRANENRKTGYA